MILNKSTISAALAAVFFGTLMFDPAIAANKKSSLTAQTRGKIEKIHPTTGGPDTFKNTDLSAVTHKNLTGDPKEVGRSSGMNYRRSDLNSVTHFEKEIPPLI